jgi:hypothetical protein
MPLVIQTQHFSRQSRTLRRRWTRAFTLDGLVRSKVAISETIIPFLFHFFFFWHAVFIGITDSNQNGRLVGTNRMTSTAISPCCPAGTPVIVSARMVGTKQSQMLSEPVLSPEAMEQRIQTPGGKRSGVSLAGHSSMTQLLRKLPSQSFLCAPHSSHMGFYSDTSISNTPST